MITFSYKYHLDFTDKLQKALFIHYAWPIKSLLLLAFDAKPPNHKISTVVGYNTCESGGYMYHQIMVLTVIILELDDIWLMLFTGDASPWAIIDAVFIPCITPVRIPHAHCQHENGRQQLLNIGIYTLRSPYIDVFEHVPNRIFTVRYILG